MIEFAAIISLNILIRSPPKMHFYRASFKENFMANLNIPYKMYPLKACSYTQIHSQNERKKEM